MMKIDVILFILLIYIALLVNTNEEEIKKDAEDVLNDKKSQQDKVDSVDNNLNGKQDTDSIDNNSNEKQDTDSIDNNSSEKQDSDSIDNNSSEKQDTDSIDNNLNEKENVDSKKETIATDSIKDTTNSEKEVTNSEKEAADSEKEAADSKKEDTDKNTIDYEENENDDRAENDNDNGAEDPFKPVIINQVRVIKDNVTGHKRSSFSEDKSENRGDEINVSQVKEEAENRILEKEMLQKEEEDMEENVEKEMLQKEEEEMEENVEEHEELPLEPEVIKTDVKDNDDLVQSEKTDITDTDGVEGGKKFENLAKDENDNMDENEGDTKKDEFDEKTSVFTPEIDTKINEDEKLSVDTAGGSEQSTDEKQIQHIYGDDEEIPKSFVAQDDEFGSLSKDEMLSSNKESKSIPKDKANIDNKKDSQKVLKYKEEDGGLLQSKEESVANEKDEKTKSPKKTAVPKKEVKVLPGAKLYDEAMELLKVGKKDTKKAYKLLAEAAEVNNTDAGEKIAYPYLFGDDIKRNKTKAVELFHSLAERGIPLGQQGLGFIYGAGLNVNSSQAKALIYTTFAALGGNAMAQMMLGYRYFNGIGVAKSCESALTHYKKVAKKVTDETTSHGGNAVQRIRLYDELEQPGGTSGQIDEDLLQYYQFLADKGDLQAQVGLGQLYFQGGRGIDVNYEKAFKYFQLAGDVDNGNGLAYLGKMYLDGLHVVKDQKKAFEYFTKAAEQSNPIGQAGLGMIYLKGAGVKKDYDQAMKYFSQAAEQGWMEGQLQLGNMYYNGIGVKKDYRQAVKYFTFASQSGHVMAFYNLASMHATGAGVMRSCNTATELFKNVAERGKWSMMFMDAYDSYRAGDLETALLKYYYLAELGYEVAQSNVAYVLEKGELSWFSQNQTYARSLLQWSRAAHQGYAVARVKVGDYHFYGYGTKVDYDAAALHYRMASDQQNNPQAMFNLGYMHEQGFGLKEDIHLAKRFYDMAAEASPDAHFPVTLALLKLTWHFTWEWILKNYRVWEYAPFESWWLYILQKLGPDWDMYLITVLAILLGGLLLFRRTLRR